MVPGHFAATAATVRLLLSPAGRLQKKNIYYIAMSLFLHQGASTKFVFLPVTGAAARLPPPLAGAAASPATRDMH